MTLTLTRPDPGDPMALSNGKPQTTIVDDIMDGIEQLYALLNASAAGAASVSAAATTMVLTSAFTQANTVYQVMLETSWLTTWIAGTKTTTGLTVTFGTAAPVGGGTVYWRIERLP